ncbi:alpha-glucosyltransferase N-terminal domain-containing protein (plasmid) [Staphylococcus saprophyticus]|nr:alpha-glucosyltransferase N-terminal domain-containing protein [Staphylococcus saprophyticus]
MKKIYLLINSLELERGGLTKANLQQASMFSELGYETYILTFNYNSDYNGIIEDIYDVYKVNKKVKIINMYDYFRNEDQIDQKFKSYKNLINDDSIVEKNDSKDIVKIYENGLYKKIYLTEVMNLLKK